MNSEHLIPFLLTTAWLAPLAGFVLNILGGFSAKNRRDPFPAYIAISCIGVSFVASAAAVFLYQSPLSGTYFTLAEFGSLKLSLDYIVDGLSVAMCLVVTLVSLCVHIFSAGYMDEELTDELVDHQVDIDGGHLHRVGRFDRFFAFLGLFSFSMMGLVLSGNLLQTFIFWELVGATSYFLIGFYYERSSASNAANKAFIMNRIGDAGFLIGLAALFTIFGNFSFEQDFASSHTSEATLTLIGLGIFAGCVGKSAQFPLQTWLPDAMEGPTPVSALVHSATMVAAGVYLVARAFPLMTPDALELIAWCGCVTLIIGAVVAIVQTDIKRVLAYSTISQLGYMMVALGCGGWSAGVFHLFTHAFFKSLLFLGAGSVIHACHHEQDMLRLGGLRKRMPVTAVTMLVGVIAISGLALPGFGIAGIHWLGFAGFYSKDAILIAAHSQIDANPPLFYVSLVGAGLTAFYMLRLWCMTFLGDAQSESAEHAHESPQHMVAPLVLLALLAVFSGFGGESGPIVEFIGHGPEVAGTHAVHHDESVEEAVAAEGVSHDAIAVMGLIAAVIGTALAIVLYGVSRTGESLLGALGPFRKLLLAGGGFDWLYDRAFVLPVKAVGGIAAMIDRYLIDAFLHFVSKATVFVASIDRFIDENLVDGAVNGLGALTMSFGQQARLVQTGSLRQYVMFIALGVIAIAVLAAVMLPM
ncbi:NADH-quinone oxidoreductase subunit L [Calycomorphotria hydatis]|uniref:NADH-quinone oxidoreductase subunit L n=1 Tax=Calycomorphotria hydatis TaxID=2528027 RepID=A0A517T6P5_9PLAN|nr:NADH-quinone oxidoreductase subunit L [Calycomorphotria hydatis]QDT64046.1 NADH-quinone oxidoreductase subunit L [Calycomorphotria hydatis]